MNIEKAVEQFLFRKAALCDGREWADYIALFDADCEFHVPQWDSEHEYTRDPRTGLSLIYYRDRAGLEDRVYRINTGKSAASEPMPRTQHLISNIQVGALESGHVDVRVNWNTFSYRFAHTNHFYGFAEYRLRQAGEALSISRKHVVLLNDTINEVLDFYHL